MTRVLLVCSIIAIALVNVCPSTAVAHPFHLCVGQMKWNPQSKVWEVSLRLHPQDLELAMQQTHSLISTKGSGNAVARVERFSAEDSGFDDAALSFIESHLFLYRTSTAMNLKELQTLLSLNRSVDLDARQEQRSKLRWIGKEQEKGWLWIHLEMIPPPTDLSIQKLWLIHDVLIEQVAKQENTMSVDPTLSPKFSLQFKKEATIQEFAKTK